MIKIKASMFSTSMDYRDIVREYNGLYDLESALFNDIAAYSYDEDDIKPMIYIPINDNKKMFDIVEHYAPLSAIIAKCRNEGFWSKYFIIHLIVNEDGIIFSDGKCTSGIVHRSSKVTSWLKRLDKRMKSDEPLYSFVD